jgi:hypothetical protein
MSLVEIIAKKDRLTKDELLFVMNINTKKDYLMMNYLQQEISHQHGPDFFVRSCDKIQYIMGFILSKKFDDLYDMYSGSLEVYFKTNNNQNENMQGFNIVFVTLIHLAMKVIRKHKTTEA